MYLYWMNLWCISNNTSIQMLELKIWPIYTCKLNIWNIDIFNQFNMYTCYYMNNSFKHMELIFQWIYIIWRCNKYQIICQYTLWKVKYGQYAQLNSILGILVFSFNFTCMYITIWIINLTIYNMYFYESILNINVINIKWHINKHSRSKCMANIHL